MSFKNSLLPWNWGRKNIPVRKEDSWQDSSSMVSLQQDMNRIFESFFHSFENSPFGLAESGSMFPSLSASSGLFQPRLDVAENDKELQISVELPGLDEKDFDVAITKTSITIKGEKREEKVDSTSGYYRMERHYGSFQRTIPFPCQIDADKAAATFKKGVLTVVLPKMKDSISDLRKITVRNE